MPGRGVGASLEIPLVHGSPRGAWRTLTGVDICDGDLLRQARAGDAAAFRLLVERHWPSARARATRLCGRADDADDIVQEAFLRAFMALDRLRDPDRFGAWLDGIIRNVHRAAGRQEPLMLVVAWAGGLHPGF